MADFSLAGLLRLRRRQEDQAAGTLLRARSRASELAARRTGVRDAMLEQSEEQLRGLADDFDEGEQRQLDTIRGLLASVEGAR